MKKQILLLLLICLGYCLQAQNLLPNRYGIQVGVNISDLKIQTEEGIKKPTTSYGYGIAGGFYMQIPLNNKIYINSEILYSQKTTSFDYDYVFDYPVNQRDEYTTTNKLTLNYIELNPSLSYMISYKLGLNIGPSLTYMISNAYTFEEKLIEEFNTSTTPLNLEDGEYIESSLDIGLNIGFSYYINSDFIIGARVNTGFISSGEVMRPTDLASEESQFDLFNRSTNISLSYLF